MTKIKKEKISWQKADAMCAKLAAKVKRSFHPDLLIGISRGGLVPLRLLSDYLEVRELGVVGVKFYSAVGKTKGKPVVTQRLNVAVAGKKVLVVDDVADSGKTLALVVKMLKKRGAKAVRSATLHYKKSSIVKPDFYVKETRDWIVYPWEKQKN